MIHHIRRGEIPPKPGETHSQNEQAVHEHCFVHQGGAYSLLYHYHPPQYIKSQVEMGSHSGKSELESLAKPMRYHFDSNQLRNAGTVFLGRQRLMGNADLNIWFAVADQADPTLVCNADGDELIYVCEGEGQIETPFGVLTFKSGDHVFLPCNVIHRWMPSVPLRLLVVEGLSGLDIPQGFKNNSGQLKAESPFLHRDFHEPAWHPELYPLAEIPQEVIVKRDNYLYKQAPRFHPFDILGWDGQVWPFVLPSTLDIHFAGSGVQISSLRALKANAGLQRSSFLYSSQGMDRVSFHIQGGSHSQSGLPTGSLSLHARGIPHQGWNVPSDSKINHQLALVVDSEKPLYPTHLARAIENKNYQYSWVNT